MIIRSKLHLAQIERKKEEEIKEFWQGEKLKLLDDGKNKKLMNWRY